jgi:glycosyltransferase involved in cell wall biosynthesis
MKITHIIMNLGAGGAQTFVASLAIEQRKLGHDVSIIVIDHLAPLSFESKLLGTLQENSVDLYFLNRRLGKNLTILTTVNGIIKTLSAVQPDIINTHISTAHLIVRFCLNLALSRLKKRHIITVHNAPEKWHWLTSQFNKHTPTIYCSFASLDMNPPRDCLKVAIQNGIPFFNINDSAKQVFDQLPKEQSPSFVLCVGRLSKQKNYDMVCEIAKHFEDKNVVFLICGMKQATAEHDLANFNELSNIHYLGTKTQEEIYSLMGHCDCFLNASLYEGLPITVLEAFFSGIPCVLSEIPPHIEIGTDMPFCYIADLHSIESFIYRVGNALDRRESNDEILRLRMPFLKKYGIKTTASNYQDFYNKVIGND